MSTDRSGNSPAEKQTEHDEGAVTSKLIRELLANTLHGNSIELKPEEWKSLREVVVHGQSTGLNTLDITTNVVDELLRHRFSSLSSDEAARKRVSSLIAHALSADPPSRQRLLEFHSFLLQYQP